MDERRLAIDTDILLAMHMGPTETTPAFPDRHSMPPEARAQVRRSAGRAPWILVLALALVVGLVAWLARRQDDPGARPAIVQARFEAERARAFALLEQGHAAEAIPVYEGALALVDDVGARINLANALKAVGRVADASNEYQHVLRLAPRHADAWYDYGNLLYRSMHDARGAVEAWRKATECDPNLGEAHFALGVALLESGDYETAVASLQAAVQVAPRQASWRPDAESALDVARLRLAEQRGVLPPPRK